MKILISISLALTLCVMFTSGDQAFRVTRTVPKSNGKVLLKAKCVFKSSVRVEAGEREFDIQLDTEIKNFKSKQVKVISGSTTGIFFEVETIKVMRPDTRFAVIFSGLYVGDATTPVPTGTCSEMRPTGETTTTSTTTTSTTPEPTTTTTTTSEPTTTTSTTSEPTTTTSTTSEPTTTSTTTSTTSELTTTSTTTSTTSEPTTTMPPTSTTTVSTTTTQPSSQAVSGVVHKVWPEGSCKRMYGLCNFTVSEQIEPETTLFNITFNSAVTGFQQWAGEIVDDSNSKWITTMNKYAIRPGVLTYGFQSLYTGDAPPAISCTMALQIYTRYLYL